MATTRRKNLKVASARNAGENGDLISRLPNAILIQVLSLIPVDEAVRTSILSSKWRYIWALTTTLQFVMPSCQNRAEAQQYVEFVDRIMALRNGMEIQNFSFRGFTNFEHDRIYKIICTVVKFDLKVLNIQVCGPRRKAIKLAPSIYMNFRMLVELGLSDNVVLEVPSQITLPSLKTLELKSVTYLDEDSVKNLFFGCPVLEELVVERCLQVASDNIETFNISVASLKKLTLFFGLQSHPCHGADCKFSTVIDTPNLEYLSLSDHMSGNFFINSILLSLVEAYVDVGNECRATARGFGGYGHRVLGLLTSISNAKSLSLSGRFLNSLTGNAEFPWFNNLVSLTLGIDQERGWYLLSSFLQSIRNLETLVFSDGLGYWGYSGKLKSVFLCRFEQTMIAPRCLREKVQTIKINGLSVGSTEEVSMIKYLLERSLYLKTMIISGFKASPKIRKILLDLPKASPACQLIIS